MQTKEELSRKILKFLDDKHRSVQVNAHKSLPMFIATVNLPKDNPMIETLLNHYFKLIDSELHYQVGSNEIIRSISFTFPAVLEALGKERWPQLYPLFIRLLKFADKDIKAPLVFSLHEIGRMIGPDLAKEHLFPCLDNILRDGTDYLKLGSISHLTEFVAIFNSEIK